MFCIYVFTQYFDTVNTKQQTNEASLKELFVRMCNKILLK